MKTAQELGLMQEQFDALLKVKQWLEAGAPHHGIGGTVIRFNMILWNSRDTEGCGTACCMGGAAELFSGVDGLFSRFKYDPAEEHDRRCLSDLFYMDSVVTNNHEENTKMMVGVTPEQALHALTNYLENGWADWKAVLA